MLSSVPQVLGLQSHWHSSWESANAMYSKQLKATLIMMNIFEEETTEFFLTHQEFNHLYYKYTKSSRGIKSYDSVSMSGEDLKNFLEFSMSFFLGRNEEYLQFLQEELKLRQQIISNRMNLESKMKKVV